MQLLQDWLACASVAVKVSQGTAACRMYDLYTDYVLKNPFYEVEMPVRCELFDVNLFQVIDMVHSRWGITPARGK